MSNVTIRTAGGELVSGELVTNLTSLTDWQQRHVMQVARRWNRVTSDREAVKSLAHLLIWWDQLNLDLPAIEWHLLNLGIAALPGTYAGPGPWERDLNPNGRLHSGIDWRRL